MPPDVELEDLAGTPGARSSAPLPVSAWRLHLRSVSSHERTRFNSEPITGVDYVHDINYLAGDVRAHHLHVLAPAAPAGDSPEGRVGNQKSFPVYV